MADDDRDSDGLAIRFRRGEPPGFNRLCDARIVRRGGSLAVCDVVLELAFVIDIIR